MHIIDDTLRALLDQEPSVVQIQRDLMFSWGFRPAKRDGKRVLWEMEQWPEVHFWLTAHQNDLGLTYVMMLCYVAGLRDRTKREIDATRAEQGLPPVIYEDQERLASFRAAWTQLAYLQLSPADMAGS